MNVEGVITVDVRDMLALDQNVFDSMSKEIGEVSDVDYETGWFTIAAGTLYEKQYFVPVTMVKYIDPNELFLSADEKEVQRDYSTPPPRTTSVEGEGPATTATTWQPSGYGDASVVVHQARLDDFRTMIDVGFRVCTADMVYLGKVREYDSPTGLMVLDKGRPSKHDIVVPITMVDRVEAETHEIVLIASKRDVERITPVSLVRTAAKLASES
ncbi:MAG: hypothetical protein WB802_02090 [Candidatus Dormiibacterota bacterium]|jgi:hypothetical protein